MTQRSTVAMSRVRRICSIDRLSRESGGIKKASGLALDLAKYF